jgi:hypothetical protein
MATTRLNLPMMHAGQAQKEMTYNEALALIDLVLHPVVEAIGLTTPPAAPVAGQAWIVGAAANGAWAGQALYLAGWTDGGWRFVAPLPGMQIWVKDVALWARFDGADWVVGDWPVARIMVNGTQILGGQTAAITVPAGGSVIDAESRGAIGQILAALRTHGIIAT